VAALEERMAAAKIDDGPVFRSVNRHGRIAATALHDRGVARIVQKLAATVGLDATRYSGHSLRAGFATSAAMNGVEERGSPGRRSTARAEPRSGLLYWAKLVTFCGLALY
jgi:integrase